MILGDQRKPFALLLLGAEQHQRLGDADRLVRREHCRDRGVRTSGQGEGAVVVHLRQTESAVLLGYLHAERAQPFETFNDLVGDLRVALDLERVDVLLQERPQAVEEALALLDRGRIERRLGVDQVKAEVAEEQLLAEARQLPLGLARRLDDLSCLALGDGDSHGISAPLTSSLPAGSRGHRVGAPTSSGFL